jgi:RND family efflux transporter MFP subunit
MRRCIAGLGALALLALLGACKQEAQTEIGPPVRPVLTVKAEVRTTDTLGPFAGSIQPRYSTDYSFRLFGRMAARFVNVGDIVQRNDEIAAIDPALQLIQVRNAEAAVASAEAQLANTQAEESRQRPLVERNITPQAQFDLIVQNRESAAANLTRAKATLRRAQDSLSYTQLRADFAGVVTGAYIDAGQVVNTGQKIVTIARPEVREAVIAVPNALADSLAAGVAFDMVVDLDQTVKMKVAAVRGIDPTADPVTRTRAIFLTLNDPPTAFRLGITISVTMSKPVSPRVDLPATAVFEQGGKPQVWIVDPEKKTVSTRAVAVGPRDDGMVAITDGIKAGERVVVVGVHSLTPGQTVKIQDAPGRRGSAR